MAKQSAGFVHEHIEKVVVGICGVVLLGAVYMSFAGGRFNTDDGKSPGDLLAELDQSANQAIGYVRNAKGPTDSGADVEQKEIEGLKDWYGENRKPLYELVNIPNLVARTQPFPPLFISTAEVSEADKHNLVKLVQPDAPVVMAGRTEFTMPDEKPSLDEYHANWRPQNTKRVETNWVGVASQVDLFQQEIEFKTEKYPADSYLAIVKVHLQRFDTAAPWRGWQDVETYLPFEEFERPPLAQVGRLRELIDLKQEFIARTKLPSRESGDRPDEFLKMIPYLEEPPPPRGDDQKKRAREWADLAEKAADGKRPFETRDVAAAMLLARAAMKASGADSRDLKAAQEIFRKASRKLAKDLPDYQPRSENTPPDKMMPIVAYDMDAIPGHTYKYRLRYEVVNHYAGNSGELRNPNDASQLTLFSDWSPPTRDVRIEADTQFFITDADPTRNRVRVRVWKKGRREFANSAFTVEVGEMIGGKTRGGTDFSTGAQCVDLLFDVNLNGKSDVMMVYVASDGSLRETLLSVDKELDKEFQQRAQ